MEYNNYLQTTWWRKRKNIIYNSNKRGKSCYVCKNKTNIDLHHIRYFNKAGQNILFREKLKDLIPLCRSCHMLWHSMYDKKELTEKHLNRIRTLLGYQAEKQLAFELAVMPAAFKSIIAYYKNFAGKKYYPILTRNFLLRQVMEG